MLTISKPLSASQARTYHAREFAAQELNYWSRDQQGHSEWQGRLAEQWNLTGTVEAEHFARLSEGQDLPLGELQACSASSGFENLRREIRQGSDQR